MASYDSIVNDVGAYWSMLSADVPVIITTILSLIKQVAFDQSSQSKSLIDRIVSISTQYDALSVSLVVCIAFIYYSFTWSIIGNNCSKVDQIWSITPVVFAWLFYLLDGTNNVRVFTIAVLVTLWGSRLTFNFWRRGGYGNLLHHEEDYRWPILRQQINNPVLFYIFNLTFIASYQNLLLWFICLPIYVVSKQSQRSLTSGDVLVSVLFIVLLIFETLSDQQQWNFQNFKYSFSAEQRAKHVNKDVRDGFLTKGLFTYTRHPNYFCEQSIWVAVYLFSVTSSDGQWLNWSVLGVIQLIALFVGSM